MKNFKLAIGLPITDSFVDINFFKSWTILEKPDFVLCMPLEESAPIDHVRNGLIRQAREHNCTHIILLDTDQWYHRDTIMQLLKNKHLPAVGAVVYKRLPPFSPVVARLRRDPKGVIHPYYLPDEEITSGKLVEIDRIGTGCVMFQMQVFHSIAEPWFEFTVNEDEEVVSEDIYFCQKLQQAGYTIHVDTGIDVKHISKMLVDKTIHDIFMKANGLKKQIL